MNKEKIKEEVMKIIWGKPMDRCNREIDLAISKTAQAIFDDFDNVDIVEWDTLENAIKTKVDGQHNVDYILAILKEAVRDRINEELKKKWCDG